MSQSPQNSPMFDENILSSSKEPEGVSDMHTEMQNAPLLRESVTMRCEPEDAFDVWRDFSNLPRFMTDITKIEVKSDKTSHWIVDLPRGPKVEWDAEILSERYGEMISWRSLEDSAVKQSGTIWFSRAPADRGTVVSLSLSYDLPGGKIAEFASKLMLEDPKTLVLQNLRRFKAYMETGEIPTIEGQPNGQDGNAIH